MRLRMHLYQPTRRDQSGFSAIEALLVVLAIAVISATGFVIYQRHKNASAKTSAATGSSQSTSQPQNTTITQPAQTASQYLTIKEWGIKLLLSDSIKDAYYVIPSGMSKNADGLPSGIWLSVTSLNSSCGDASVGNTNVSVNNAVGEIVRSLPTETDPVSGKLYTQLEPSGTTIGNYYYGYTSGTKKTCAPATTLQSIDSAFAAAAKGIVAATQYLDIKEWGIRAPYSGSLKLTYTMSAENKSATFSSDQLTALTTDCTGRGGSIIRWASTDQVSEGPPDANTPTAAEAFAGKDPSAVPYAHIGNYYFTFAHAQSGCGNIDSTTTIQSQTNNAVKALVPILQAIPN
jgi:hypothetical protein